MFENNAICKLLNIKYPIFQGGMAWIGTAELASAVSNAGGLGIIGAGHMPPEILRAEIQKCKGWTDKPFGVNVMLMSPYVKEVMQVVLEEKVPVVTTGAGNPGEYVPALKEIGTKDLDLVVLENVGNLVCPAEFDTGAVKNAMILSVPEGHDKPLKYPLIFTVCDALIINKIDVLPYFDFDMEKVVEYAHMRNPKLKIFPLSAKTGEGVDAWCDWLREQVRDWNE